MEEQLKEFARWILNHALDGGSVDGYDAQDKAAELGLLNIEPFDPHNEIHQNICCAEEMEPGDEVYIFIDYLKQEPK